MDYNTDKIYFRDTRAFLLTSILLSILFISGVGMQGFFPVLSIQLIVSIFLVMISFLLNIVLGMTGFVLSMVLNLLQVIIYSYKLLRFGDSNHYYLLAITGLSIVIIVVFQIFMRRVSNNIISLREKIDEEQQRRINSETTSLIESSMMRPTLIVKHEDIKDAGLVSEAIGNSRSSHLDSLTTLPGREKIFERIDNLVDEAIRESSDRKIRVIYMTAIDAENFLKNLGHRATDLFIQCIAHRIRECADPDDLVGRISRLEFVIVTNRDITEDAFTSYINSLIMAAEDSVMDDAGHAKLKYYAGYSMFPEISRFSGDLLSEAEIAVREAIRTGVNPLHYSSDSSAKTFRDSPLSKLDTDILKNTIKNAILGDEFYMVYQPQFNSNKKLIGFEAFARWDSPLYGQIDTSDFLIAAEHVDMIYDIGIICIRKSIEALALINSINPDLTMAINLATAQLQDLRIVTDISDLISVNNIKSNNVIIDIPEESLLTNINASRPVIEGFAGIGVTMALDNFGRCYSSLNNIPLFPISIVKLDGHFTADLKEGSHFRILSASIIDLLSEIDIPVHATGVASEEQFQVLSSFGCKYFQGRHFSAPLTLESISEYIKGISN